MSQVYQFSMARVKRNRTESPEKKLIDSVKADIVRLHETHDRAVLTKDPDDLRSLRALESRVEESISELGIFLPTESLVLWDKYHEYKTHLDADLGFNGRKLYKTIQ